MQTARCRLFCTVVLAVAGSCLGLQVTEKLQLVNNLTCQGTASRCFCHDSGQDPRQRYTLKLSLSLPLQSSLSDSKHPVVVFLHGYGGRFTLTTGDYAPYSTAATGAGYAFLQYDIVSGAGFSGDVADAIEIQFMPKLLGWLSDLDKREGTPAYGRIDATRLAIAGHSRGGKLAALHYAQEGSKFFAAYLIDPVDCPCFAPCESNCYPSALTAIATAKRPLAVSGASIKGCCNPRTTEPCSFACMGACYAATGNGTCTGNDYQDFLDAGSKGSRSYTQDAGHMQFAAISSQALQYLANVFCGSEKRKTAEEVSSATATHMMDWFISKHELLNLS